MTQLTRHRELAARRTRFSYEYVKLKALELLSIERGLFQSERLEVYAEIRINGKHTRPLLGGQWPHRDFFMPEQGGFKDFQLPTDSTRLGADRKRKRGLHPNQKCDGSVSFGWYRCKHRDRACGHSLAPLIEGTPPCRPSQS